MPPHSYLLYNETFCQVALCGVMNGQRTINWMPLATFTRLLVTVNSQHYVDPATGVHTNNIEAVKHASLLVKPAFVWHCPWTSTVLYWRVYVAFTSPPSGHFHHVDRCDMCTVPTVNTTRSAHTQLMTESVLTFFALLCYALWSVELCTVCE